LGRKRNWTRKYIYIFIACVIITSLIGCAALTEINAKRDSGEYLVAAQKLFDRGDYDGALKMNRKVLSLYGNVPPGDEAFFNIGIIYAHHGYPKRNFGKSLEHFKKLVKVFPRSPLAGKARTWIGVLQDYEKLNTENENTNKSIKTLQQENERLNKEIEELKKTITKSKQVDIEIEGKKKELSK